MKEVSATKSFLNMDQKIRGCQSEEPYENCTTRKYLEAVIENCKCLPFAVKMDDEVDLETLHSNIILFLKGAANCDEEGLKCSKEMNKSFADCLKNCEGMVITSYDKKEKNLEYNFQDKHTNLQYEIFKKKTEIDDNFLKSKKLYFYSKD